MEPVYFEVKGIEFKDSKDALLRTYVKRREQISEQLEAIHKKGGRKSRRLNGEEKDAGALVEELYEVADATITRRHEIAAESLGALVQEINRVPKVNLDHQQIRIFPFGVVGYNYVSGTYLDLDKAEKPFLEYKGSGATVGIAISFGREKAFIAVGGGIDPKRFERELKKRGYHTDRIEGIPKNPEITPLFSYLAEARQSQQKQATTAKPARVQKPELVSEPAQVPKPVIKTVYDVLVRRAEGRVEGKEITREEIEQRVRGEGEYAPGGRYSQGRITQEQAERLYEIVEKQGIKTREDSSKHGKKTVREQKRKRERVPVQ